MGLLCACKNQGNYDLSILEYESWTSLESLT